jgi:hypothetical protein
MPSQMTTTSTCNLKVGQEVEFLVQNRTDVWVRGKLFDAYEFNSRDFWMIRSHVRVRDAIPYREGQYYVHRRPEHIRPCSPLVLLAECANG